jgi:hypothetical protein
MREKKLFQFFWLLTILAVVSLSCSLAAGVVPGVSTATLTQTPTGSATATGGAATEGLGLGAGMMETMLPNLIPTDLDIFGGGGTVGPVPTDIPVMPGGELEESSPTRVVYTLDTEDVNQVVNFYNQEMTKNGWAKVEVESKVGSQTATLVFSKDTRKATFTIEVDDLFGGMTVTIDIVTK